jgi:tRNA pseudouridine55 synthase
VRRVLRERSVGHAGTLDPFATGLLVVLVGRATRLARYVERQAKGYLAEAVLGVATDTDDATGAVVRRPDQARPLPPEEEIRAALATLVGRYPQRPPAYSARRVAGERAYRLARRGEPVDLPATEVTVHALEAVEWAAPVLRFRAVVSAGTYIRALARDLGERLGVGAHLAGLRREWIGPLRVEQAHRLETIDAGTPLLPPLDLVAHLPRVELGAEELEAVSHGRSVVRDFATGEAALVREGRLVAVAEAIPAGWQPRVVLEAT